MKEISNIEKMYKDILEIAIKDRDKAREENKKLYSIIKEVREFIKYDIKQLKGSEFLLRKLDLKELLEILDKVEESK